MASATTMAMITTTTKISTKVKPLLRMLRHHPAPGPGACLRLLTLIDRRGADVCVVAFAPRLAVLAVGGDFIGTAIRTGTHILVRVVPWILRQRPQVALGPIIRDGGIGRLLHQRLQPLFAGRVLEVVESIRVQGGLNRANVAYRARNTGLIDILQNLWHHERAQ